MESSKTFWLFLVLLCGGHFVKSYQVCSSEVESNIITPSLSANEILPKIFTHALNAWGFKPITEVDNGDLPNVDSCSVCLAGVSFLQVMIANDTESIREIVIKTCEDLHMLSSRACVGTVNAFQVHLVYVMKLVQMTPQEICGMLIGYTCSRAINPKHVWTLPMTVDPKPPVHPVKPPQPGSPSMKVLHITDIHYDPHYVEGMNAVCGDPICCQRINGPPSKLEYSAGKWGDYRGCDSPLNTLEKLLEQASRDHEVKYIIWTGDSPAHDFWNLTREDVISVLQNVSSLIRKHFPSTPVYPALGNHDSDPMNSIPPLNVLPAFTPTWLYSALNDSWGFWLDSEARTSLENGGFYSMKVADGLKIISLNSGSCYSLNYWLLLNSTDPDNQLQWLIQELLESERNNEKVQIIAHVPPGKPDCLKSWSATYTKIINRFESTVSGQFFGHTHQDEFEVFYDTDLRPTNIAYISPSVTTFGGINPSFRIFTIDGDYPNSSFAVLDHENYYLNLTDANNGGPAEWIKAYSAREEYNLTSLQPDEWNRLINIFEKDDQLFQKFYRNYYMLSDYVKDPCNGTCKLDMLCSLKTSQSNDPTWCKTNACEDGIIIRHISVQ